MKTEQLVEQITEKEAVEIAYQEDLAWCQRKLISRASVLIECEKQLIPWIYMHLRSRLRSAGVQMEYLDGRKPVEQEGEQRGASVLRIMIQQVTWHVRNTAEDKILVLPHLDLLTSLGDGTQLSAEARELLPLLYENPKVVFLTFKDPNFNFFKAVENLFVARRRFLGIERRALPHLITRSEGRKFPLDFEPSRLYSYVSGCNAVRIRQILSRLEGVDYPATADQVIQQLRELTLQDGMSLPNVDLQNDIAGYANVKQKLNSEILYLLKALEKTGNNPEVEQLLPRGIIFYGPPGTGKTYFAKAMATALNATIQIVSGPELKSMWVGQSEENIRRIFFRARQSAPSIIVFDELDSFASSRSREGSHHVQHSMVNQLLTEMDGFRKEELVFVVGTTNFVESLDEALLRPGRFEMKLCIELPDEADRLAILTLYNRKLQLGLSEEQLHWLSQKTGELSDPVTGSRYSGDHLYGLCRFLKRWSIRENKVQFNQEDLLLALRGGEIRVRLTDHERQVVATHECGHALIALSLKDSQPLERVSVDSDLTDTLGFVQHAERENRHVITKKQMLAELIILMGGREAEQLIYSDISSGSENDVLRATRLASAMVSRYGMSEGFGVRTVLANEELSAQAAHKRDEAIDILLQQARTHARRILEARLPALRTLSAKLVEQRNMTRSEVMAVLQSVAVEEI